MWKVGTAFVHGCKHVLNARERTGALLFPFFSLYHYQCTHACAYILERACTPQARVHAYREREREREHSCIHQNQTNTQTNKKTSMHESWWSLRSNFTFSFYRSTCERTKKHLSHTNCITARRRRAGWKYLHCLSGVSSVPDKEYWPAGGCRLMWDKTDRHISLKFNINKSNQAQRYNYISRSLKRTHFQR